ncbi:MAG: hypothetical protein N4A40_03705 [Tissierellales bacterium]|jgi:hypothetical protein|nr:hypothetical protein [Tissierellales bacterium]
MKKMFFGGLLFMGGIFGSVGSLIVAGLNPSISHKINGLLGWLLRSGAIVPYLFFSFMGFVGTIICMREAFFCDDK